MKTCKQTNNSKVKVKACDFIINMSKASYNSKSWIKQEKFLRKGYPVYVSHLYFE